MALEGASFVEKRGRTPAALSSVRLALNPEVHPFLLGESPALFLEQQQQLIELNGTAGAMIARLVEGTTLEDLESFAMEGKGALSDREAFEAMLLEWSSTGIASITFDPADPWHEAGTGQLLDAGVWTYRLQFAAGAFGQALAAPYAHLPCCSGTVDPRLQRLVSVIPFGNLAIVIVDGQSRFVPISQAASQMRFAMVSAILAHSEVIALHAACAVRNGKAILLCGAPGTGKSTMVRALAQHGFTVSGDDIVLFDPVDGTVRGVPLPLTLKSGNWGLLGDVGSEPEQRADGVGVRYAPLPSYGATRALPVRAIIALDRRDGVAPGLRDWPVLDGVRWLFSEGYAESGRSSFGTVRAIVDLASTADLLRLEYAEADEAAALMEGRLGD